MSDTFKAINSSFLFGHEGAVDLSVSSLNALAVLVHIEEEGLGFFKALGEEAWSLKATGSLYFDSFNLIFPSVERVCAFIQER